MSGILGGIGGTGAASGGMALGDAGSAMGGGFESMMGGASPYDVPSAAQPSGMGGGNDQGLLEMLAQAQGSGRGGGGMAPPQHKSAFIGMPGLMALGNRHQARNQNARQAYRNGLLGG